MKTKYSDASVFGRRQYEICENLLKAVGKQGVGADFEASLRLSALDPSYDKLSLRNPLFTPMCYLTSIGVFGAILIGVLLGDVSPANRTRAVVAQL